MLFGWLALKLMDLTFEERMVTASPRQIIFIGPFEVQQRTMTSRAPSLRATTKACLGVLMSHNLQLHPAARGLACTASLSLTSLPDSICSLGSSGGVCLSQCLSREPIS